MKSPLLGFNNNVRHKGRVFHIQTEDSGVNRPHIITHLFADGGRILKTIKTSYAEHVEAENMAETVTAMMKEQHKAMFVALRDGQYDHLIDAPVGAPKTGVNQVPVMPPATGVNKVPSLSSIPAAASSQPGGPPPTGSNAIPAIPMARGSQPSAPPPPPPPPLNAAAPAFKPPAPPGYTPPPGAPTPPPLPAAAQRAPSRPVMNALRGEGAPPDAGYQARMQPERPVDLEALERAAQEVQTPFFQQMQDLPPPPAAVLAKKPSGSHSSASLRAVSPDSRAPSDPPANPSPGRYAQPRPAAVFGATRPAEGVSIFGEDLISEKSLDEVILSYLAEDLDTPSEKK